MMKKIAILLISLLSITSIAFSQNCTNCDGNNTITPENYSSTLGIENTSTGQASFASGKLNIANNVYTTALGFQNTASGQISLALGNNVLSSGVYSLGLGSYLNAIGSRSMVLGSGASFGNPLINNIGNSLMIGFGSNKSTFFVNAAPGSNKTGTVGIGDVTDPLAKLHIKSDYLEDAVILLEPNIWNSDGWAEVRIGNNLNAVKASYTYGLQFKTDKNYLFNSSNANVGIGILNPAEKLDVNGNIKTTGFILNNGQQAANKILQSDANGLANWVDPMSLAMDDGDWTINGNDVYRLNGNVGIGNNNPLTSLHISNGDIFIEDINSGIIMKSPDGQCWRGKMDNNGNLQFEAIDCDLLTKVNEKKVEPKPQIQIFPNPANAVISIKAIENKEPLTIQIYNMNSSLVLSRIMRTTMIKIKTKILPAGNYFIKITEETGKPVYTEKIVIL